MNHISAYSLKVEEGTPFDRLVDSGNLTLPTEDEDREMYHGLIHKLAKAGYGQYEISNFAKKKDMHVNIILSTGKVRSTLPLGWLLTGM